MPYISFRQIEGGGGVWECSNSHTYFLSMNDRHIFFLTSLSIYMSVLYPRACVSGEESSNPWFGSKLAEIELKNTIL